MKMKLIIATPFYEMKGYSPYITSLAVSLTALCKAGVEYEYWDLSGDSYVDRARNTICERFLESDGTDLLFIDSDMSWNVMGLVNILKSPFEITGAAYPVKNNWGEFGVKIDVFEDGHPKVNLPTGLIKALWVPAGFLRIKRSALERIKAEYPHKKYEDINADPENPKRKYTSYFECEIIDGQRYGEDVSFCKKWTDIGGEIWVEPRITFSHFGLKEWEGNYHEYLHNLLGTEIYQYAPPEHVHKYLKSEMKRIVNSFKDRSSCFA